MIAKKTLLPQSSNIRSLSPPAGDTRTCSPATYKLFFQSCRGYTERLPKEMSKQEKKTRDSGVDTANLHVKAAVSILLVLAAAV